MSRIEFPNEPIGVGRGEDVTPRDPSPAERAEEAYAYRDFEDEPRDDDPDSGSCSRCGGEGTQDCDGSGADDDEDICVRADPHWHNRAACRGTGNAKDQWLW